MYRGGYDEHGGAGQRRHGHWQSDNNSKRRIFTKLLKDEHAVFRNRNDVTLFLEGMETFAHQEVVLLMKLDDKRDQGSRRISEILSFIGSIQEVENILVRFLRLVMTEETCRPMYLSLRNRVLNEIFVVPMLLQTLFELEAASLLSEESATMLCSFLKEIASSNMEGRGNAFVIDIAKQFRNRQDVDSRALCSLVVVEEHDAVVIRKQDSRKNARGIETVVWVNDERPPGGRHDNDHLNFRNVRILPTAQELGCEVRPWLPLATGGNNFIQDPVTRLISNSFRLLREDAIFAMKAQIHDGRRSWENARIVDLEISVRNGVVEFIVQCDSKNHKVNWEFSRSLSHGSVIAFCTNGAPSLMGAIGTRDVTLLASHGGPKIGVNFDSHGDHFKDALNAMINNFSQLEVHGQSDDSKDDSSPARTRGVSQIPIAPTRQFEMMEVSSSFSTYRPVLHSLQQMTELPFVEELCHQQLDGLTADLSYLPNMLQMPQDEICNGYALDLRASTVNDICSATTLDQSQARALLHVFTSRVSLIQGPPGTGTFRPSFGLKQILIFADNLTSLFV
jgi:hypothetical protein